MSFERLRRLHSGQIGDYVAWATVGFALLGGLFALASYSQSIRRRNAYRAPPMATISAIAAR